MTLDPRIRAVPYRRGPWVRRVVMLVAWLFAALMSDPGGLPAQAASPQPKAAMAAAWDAYQRGDVASATSFWQQAGDGFRALGSVPDQVLALRHQSWALRQLGHLEQAGACLESALLLARELDDRPLLFGVYNDLGAMATLTRDGAARSYLDQALAIAAEVNDPRALAQVHNNLGHLHGAHGQDAEALSAFLSSADLAQQAGQLLAASRALANAARVATLQRDDSQALDNLEAALSMLHESPGSYEEAQLLLAIAGRGIDAANKVDRQDSRRARFLTVAESAARQAAGWAQSVDHPSVASAAWALLGQLSEARGDAAAALASTRRAVFAAQRGRSPHHLYRGQWQTGRLLQAMNRTREALAAYRRAAETFESIRADVLLGHGNLSGDGDFRSDVGALYYGLADLLLQEARDATGAEAEARALIEARSVIERFKSAELMDYFQDRCLALVEAQQVRIEDVSPGTAVVYMIPLPDRLEILLSVAGGLERFTVEVRDLELTREVESFHKELQDVSTRLERRHGRRLYDWLVAPISEELEAKGIDTLVFVPDGPLRTIPMAALHDGQRYLIERYAVAVTPGLTLTAPSAFSSGQHRLLAAGLSRAVHSGFGALPHVPVELNRVSGIFGGQALLDEGFLAGRLKDEVDRSPYSIVHIASHGHFGASARDCFILTYDTKLTLPGLERIIGPSRFRDRPLELLTLSACDTAAGDDRAALGLAGVALRFGARSALATLWTVQDQATTVIVGDFYQHLVDHPGDSKAQALRDAQIRWIRDRDADPYFWSAYLIIGNWL